MIIISTWRKLKRNLSDYKKNSQVVILLTYNGSSSIFICGCFVIVDGLHRQDKPIVLSPFTENNTGITAVLTEQTHNFMVKIHWNKNINTNQLVYFKCLAQEVLYTYAGRIYQNTYSL